MTYVKNQRVERKVAKDKPGLIRAILADVQTPLTYDQWQTLVGIIKFEVEDEQEGYDIFEEFSERWEDEFDQATCYNKFHNDNIQGNGSASLGSLVFWLKEDLGNSYNFNNYSKYYDTESVSAVAEFKRKRVKKGNSLPKHILEEIIVPIPLPESSVGPELALTSVLIPDQTYLTTTDPRQERFVLPYNGDRLEQYITVNPMKKGEISEKGKYRGQRNLTDYKYAVMEFDDVSLEEQFGLFSTIDFPYAAIVHTGNKSLHAWIRIDATSLEEYKKRTRLLEKMLKDFGYSKENGNGVDTKVLHDPASWVRTPCVTRVDWDKTKPHTEGKVQRCIWAGDSSGWADWYDNVYWQYVDLSSVTEEELPEDEIKGPFEVPERDKQFTRFKRAVTKLLSEEDEEFSTEPLVEALQDQEPENIPDFLEELMSDVLHAIVKKKKKVKVSASNLYHLHEDAVMRGGNRYEGSIQEVLWDACVLAEQFYETKLTEKKERLKESVEEAHNVVSEYAAPNLIDKMEKAIQIKEHTSPEDHERVLASILTMDEQIGLRSSFLVEAEVHRYFPWIGEAVTAIQPTDHLAHRGVFCRDFNPVTYNANTKEFDKITVPTYPTFIAPDIAAVTFDAKKGFNVADCNDAIVSKLLVSELFWKNLRPVEIVSDVPVFQYNEGEASLIKTYDNSTGIFITGCPEGYEFMDIDKAKKIITDLFVDFKFVAGPDLSRCVAALLTPALTAADMLDGDFRPLFFVDADQPAAGKGTLIEYLLGAYTDSIKMITDSEASNSSLDESVAADIHSGNNLVVIDNLKPTGKTREFSSSTVEAILTTNRVSVRITGEGQRSLDTGKVVMYATSNGIPMSKDLISRSLYISIRKQDPDYQYKLKAEGVRNHMLANRPKIMSAVYTVLKEYCVRGSKRKEPVELHRFNRTIPILNSIITDIFELPDITTGLAERSKGKSDESSVSVKTILTVICNAGLRGKEINNIDIYEELSKVNQDSILNLPRDLEIYSDEDRLNLSTDAKRKIGQSLTKIMTSLLGKPDRHKDVTNIVEDYSITRYYDRGSKGARYVIDKKEEE